MHPRKLYVETTTRCNMQCGMCLKHVPGSTISNEDIDFDLYCRIRPALPKLEALVLTGIGEPLLHPNLLEMIELAKGTMPQKSWIGFQTNGALLTTDLAEKLMAAGLKRLCISVDSTTDTNRCNQPLTHPASKKHSPIAMVRDVCNGNEHHEFQLGAEIVLVKENIHLLPNLISELARDGVDFIIGSHLLSYRPEAESQSIFQTTTHESREIYAHWQNIAQAEGLNLINLTAKTWIAPQRKNEHRLQMIYKQMLAEASRKGIWINVKKLNEWNASELNRYAGYMEKAEKIAAELGVELSLPPLVATSDRQCRFMEDDSLFVSVDGSVMSCHPLWHSHTVYMDQEAKHLHQRTFGSIARKDILAIWNSAEYREFRQSVLNYDYPFCHSCSLGPCPDITGESHPFINDCFGTAVPCGHCLWCFDAIRCL